ncbi:MAG: hypothetical protein ACPGOT_02835 [Candidatus Poseidoniaceae archaeon]
MEPCPFPPAWILPHDGGTLLVGRDGELVNMDVNGQHVGQHVCPFPMTMSHGVVIGKRLLGTWIDHELRMARFAALDIDALASGPTKASVRRGEPEAMHPAGHAWSHALDAEPLGLIEHEGHVVLALHPDALYLIDAEGREIERTTLPKPVDALGGSLVSMRSEDDAVLITLRDGSHHRVSFEGLPPVLLGRSPTTQPVRDVAYGPKGRLVLTEDHEALWTNGEEVLMRARLSGPPGHVLWSTKDEAWLIAGWRERVLLGAGGFKRTDRDNVDVAVYATETSVSVLDNNGAWSAFDA